MIKRIVSRTRKSETGDITHLCRPGQPWSPRPKWQAIEDIEQCRVRYLAQCGTRKVEIVVIDGATGKYLRTRPDETTENNLLALPDC